MIRRADQVILGAGIFGLYAAALAAERGNTVAVVAPDDATMARASYANQARVHLGYHYPRSIGTAYRSAEYYRRFVAEFSDCVNGAFSKVYAIARQDSLTSKVNFQRFCQHLDIPAEEIDPGRWFVDGSVEAAFLGEEVSFDSRAIAEKLEARASATGRVEWLLGRKTSGVDVTGAEWSLTLDDGSVLSAPRVLNATYASCNQVLTVFGMDLLGVRYELCELVLGTVAPALADVGITVMDGPFFSVMPFGLSGLHSLSAVDYTPHYECDEALPRFPCQAHNPYCTPRQLDNCATCPAHPRTAHVEMQQLMRRYLRADMTFDPRSSLFGIRPVLVMSNVDDSRPTLLLRHSEGPELTTVLSGKINTVYDLEALW